MIGNSRAANQTNALPLYSWISAHKSHLVQGHNVESVNIIIKIDNDENLSTHGR